jgi:hypothetical protein
MPHVLVEPVSPLVFLPFPVNRGREYMPILRVGISSTLKDVLTIVSDASELRI